jgi:hypothetical protein
MYIAPVLKVSASLFVPVQSSAGQDKDEQCQTRLGRIMAGLLANLSFFGITGRAYCSRPRGTFRASFYLPAPRPYGLTLSGVETPVNLACCTLPIAREAT